MEEVMTTKRIRCNLTDKDMKFFVPKQKDNKVKNAPKHIAKTKTDSVTKVTRKDDKRSKEKIPLKIAKSTALWILIGAIIFSCMSGIAIGLVFAKNRYSEINHWQESVIRSEAIADYKAQLEMEEAEASAARMNLIKDDATIKKEMAIMLARLFEGVRAWNFDILDLMTYGTCALNRVRSPLFADSFDEVIHQKDQWINYSDANDVVDDYYKIAVKLVDLYYNSDVQLCSSKYCWIEIQDGHMYLKDSYNSYRGMILWRYSGEV